MRVNRLRAKRLAAGLTQLDLAYMARLAVADVSKIETGRTIPYEPEKQRLAAALGTTVAALFGSTKPPQRSRPRGATRSGAVT